MNKTRLTRRALLLSTASLVALLRSAGAGNRSRDRGIGGTGVTVEQPPEDRGIGGTGVVGTIRKFGSIIVNDMRIAYPRDAEVEIDGQPATPAQLRLGQVALAVADQTATGFATRRIVVTNEVVGPIEAVGKGALTVLGQTVSTEFIGSKGWKAGQWIAVSGLRDLDGAIVASHVQYRDDSVARVAGPVTLSADGTPRIGGLAVANLDASLAGQRVLIEVGRVNGVPAALNTVVNPEIVALPNVRQFSIETYVARSGDVARFGSGLTVAATPVSTPNAAATTAPTRAIVTVAVSPEGSLTAIAQKPAEEPEASTPDRTQPHTTDPTSPNNKTTPTEPKPTDPKAPAKTESSPAPQPANTKATVDPAPKTNSDPTPKATSDPTPKTAPDPTPRTPPEPAHAAPSPEAPSHTPAPEPPPPPPDMDFHGHHH